MGEVKGYQPEYFKKFICTGSDCSSNCCGHNWQIRIDKNTYNKYMNLEGDEKNDIIGKIKVYSEEPFIANMVMNKDGYCSFLNERSLQHTT